MIARSPQHIADDVEIAAVGIKQNRNRLLSLRRAQRDCRIPAIPVISERGNKIRGAMHVVCGKANSLVPIE